MKEFIDELISMLEEYEYSNLIEHDSEQCLHCQGNDDDGCGFRDCFTCVWDKAIEIVNKLADEYKGKPNDEWKIIYDKVCSLEREYADNGKMEDASRCIMLENYLQYFKEELLTEEYKGGWIPCERELPKDDSFCIITVEYQNGKIGVDFGWFDTVYRCWWVGIHEFRTHYVSAWMPLPAPFKEGE